MTAASDRVEQQAAEWLIHADSRGAPGLWSRLDAWLGLHPRHRAAFLRLSVAWSRAERLQTLRDPNAGVDENFLGRSSRYLHHPKSSREHRSRLLATVAAAVVLLFISAVMHFAPRERIVSEAHETTPGEQQALALTDGSRLVLNTRSRLLVRYGAHVRELTLLQGEAAFEVSADPRRPFELHTPARTFRVLGTAFTVRVHEDGHVDIAVSEGSVAIEGDGVVEAGEVATIERGVVFKRKVPPEVLEQKLAWTHGRLFFNGETLNAAAEEFNRYNRVQLRVADRELAALRIFGTFQVNDPQVFVAALSEPFGIRSREDAGRPGGKAIRLERRGS